MTTPKAKRGGKRAGSGRKRGVPNRLTRTLKQKAAEYGDDALKVLAEVMLDPKQPGAVRISAADRLLSRGYGKLDQYVEIEATVGKLPPQEVLDEITRKSLEKAEQRHREVVEGRAERLGLKLDYTSDDEGFQPSDNNPEFEDDNFN
jgi:hypothetical protein